MSGHGTSQRPAPARAASATHPSVPVNLKGVSETGGVGQASGPRLARSFGVAGLARTDREPRATSRGLRRRGARRGSRSSASPSGVPGSPGLPAVKGLRAVAHSRFLSFRLISRAMAPARGFTLVWARGARVEAGVEA